MADQKNIVIDFHTHTFPDKIAEHALASLKGKSHTRPFSDGTAAGLIERDRKAGIDLAVILPVATSPEQVRTVNDRAAELNKRYAPAWLMTGEATECGDYGMDPENGEKTAGGLLSFAGIHPAMDDAAAELRRVKQLGFRGIKIHPVYQGADIDSAPYLGILEAAADLGLIVVTHAGWDIGLPGISTCLPDKIRRAVNSVDPEGRTLKFVAAHMGGWRCWEEVPEILADTGVYVDTAFSTGRFYPLDDGFYDGKDVSMLDHAGFMRLLRAFGADRILFGTDNPWSSAEESKKFIRDLPASEEEKALILGGNAVKLLGNS